MRRTASEVLRSLGQRIARLERKAGQSMDVDDLVASITSKLSRIYRGSVSKSSVERELNNFIELVTGEDWTETESVSLNDNITTTGNTIEVYCTFSGEYGDVSAAIDIGFDGRGVSMREIR